MLRAILKIVCYRELYYRECFFCHEKHHLRTMLWHHELGWYCRAYECHEKTGVAA